MNPKRNTLTGWVIYDAERATGRSTAIALSLLGKAIANPGVAVQIREHHGTRPADESLMRLMRDMVFRLGLKGMTFSQNLTVTFNLWEPV
ncbi:hypothetical protein RsoPWF2_32 [Ralstonia phage vRsoP-WF2]|uniref:Uncharacterized protein n=1 Tax=Ralstonia phage RsoP1EGY TaxID=2070026 RepID=A0A2R2ZGC6_9CAUD|nr:hypothetical protein HOT00_gp36 [Ralstonia phage RsoP1EGY]AUO78195.1 hypothetical protein RSEGYP2_36 [Ralstonia phage RsoP1EGY]UHX60271.1 hypothetical protein RsoPWF2_32 [Ralstonia phage vRsoP-WF2]UHX60323.1 hypothetical protein RsoPWM2_32 [Ralstonia phage vRsoP-WM2]UHX60376.1 hypothetical protein RsoPWR2_33 [Ralstonia phage vRsoP-WR2]